MDDLTSILIGVDWRPVIDLAIYVALAIVGTTISVILFRRTRGVFFDLSFLNQASEALDKDVKESVVPLASSKIEIGKLGELTTALMFVKRGWIQLPSQPNGITNLDGVFVKIGHRKNYKFAIVETKASLNGDPTQNYNDDLTSEKIKNDLRLLAERETIAGKFLPEAAVYNLTRALEHNSIHIAAFLYAHDFASNTCRVYRLDKTGHKKRRVQIINDVVHRSLVLTAKTYIYRLMKLKGRADLLEKAA